ncbi:hypothetical protein Tco_0206347 [Tanacetum coccineum]|uniref:Uncharacterized protein n=1 Tax=Tanacetum coccineum TaxID=301880 RepID=A0ABQ4XN63_9ASTR
MLCFEALRTKYHATSTYQLLNPGNTVVLILLRFCEGRILQAILSLYSPSADHEERSSLLHGARDVKSDFSYGTIDEEVYVSHLPAFLQAIRNKEEIFISQNKYVSEIPRNFSCECQNWPSLPHGRPKLPLTKDEEAFDVDYTCNSKKTSHLNAVKRIIQKS